MSATRGPIFQGMCLKVKKVLSDSEMGAKARIMGEGASDPGTFQLTPRTCLASGPGCRASVQAR